jgi:hypothetical protein
MWDDSAEDGDDNDNMMMMIMTTKICRVGLRHNPFHDRSLSITSIFFWEWLWCSTLSFKETVIFHILFVNCNYLWYIKNLKLYLSYHGYYTKLKAFLLSRTSHTLIFDSSSDWERGPCILHMLKVSTLLQVTERESMLHIANDRVNMNSRHNKLISWKSKLKRLKSNRKERPCCYNLTSIASAMVICESNE